MEWDPPAALLPASIPPHFLAFDHNRDLTNVANRDLLWGCGVHGTFCRCALAARLLHASRRQLGVGSQLLLWDSVGGQSEMAKPVQLPILGPEVDRDAPTSMK